MENLTTTIEIPSSKILTLSDLPFTDLLFSLAEGGEKYPQQIMDENPEFIIKFRKIIDEYLKANNLTPLQKIEINFSPYLPETPIHPSTLISGIIILQDESPVNLLNLSFTPSSNFNSIFSTESSVIEKEAKRGDIYIFNNNGITLHTNYHPVAILLEVLPKQNNNINTDIEEESITSPIEWK